MIHRDKPKKHKTLEEDDEMFGAIEEVSLSNMIGEIRFVIKVSCPRIAINM